MSCGNLIYPELVQRGRQRPALRQRPGGRWRRGSFAAEGGAARCTPGEAPGLGRLVGDHVQSGRAHVWLSLASPELERQRQKLGLRSVIHRARLFGRLLPGSQLDPDGHKRWEMASCRSDLQTPASGAAYCGLCEGVPAGGCGLCLSPASVRGLAAGLFCTQACRKPRKPISQ